MRAVFHETVEVGRLGHSDLGWLAMAHRQMRAASKVVE
jgi:hypothetical protein